MIFKKVNSAFEEGLSQQQKPYSLNEVLLICQQFKDSEDASQRDVLHEYLKIAFHHHADNPEHDFFSNHEIYNTYRKASEHNFDIKKLLLKKIPSFSKSSLIYNGSWEHIPEPTTLDAFDHMESYSCTCDNLNNNSVRIEALQFLKRQYPQLSEHQKNFVSNKLMTLVQKEKDDDAPCFTSRWVYDIFLNNTSQDDIISSETAKIKRKFQKHMFHIYPHDDTMPPADRFKIAQSMAEEHLSSPLHVSKVLVMHRQYKHLKKSNSSKHSHMHLFFKRVLQSPREEKDPFFYDTENYDQYRKLAYKNEDISTLFFKKHLKFDKAWLIYNQPWHQIPKPSIPDAFDHMKSYHCSTCENHRRDPAIYSDALQFIKAQYPQLSASQKHLVLSKLKHLAISEAQGSPFFAFQWTCERLQASWKNHDRMWWEPSIGYDQAILDEIQEKFDDMKEKRKAQHPYLSISF